MSEQHAILSTLFRCWNQVAYHISQYEIKLIIPYTMVFYAYWPFIKHRLFTWYRRMARIWCLRMRCLLTKIWNTIISDCRAYKPHTTSTSGSKMTENTTVGQATDAFLDKGGSFNMNSFFPRPASVNSSYVMICHQKCPLHLRAEGRGCVFYVLGMQQRTSGHKHTHTHCVTLSPTTVLSCIV